MEGTVSLSVKTGKQRQQRALNLLLEPRSAIGREIDTKLKCPYTKKHDLRDLRE